MKPVRECHFHALLPYVDRGQALVECLILCVLLAPLWLGVQRIARWQDLQAAVVQQARHLGISATLSPATAGTGSNPDDEVAPLAPSATRQDYRRDPLTDAPLLAGGTAVRQVVERAALRGFAATTQSAALTLLRPIEALAPGRFDWDTEPLLRAGIEADVVLTVGLPGVPSVRRRWRDSLWVLAGDGSLSGPSDVAARTDSVLPDTPLDLAHALLQPVRGPLALIDPSVRGLCARRIDPEQVPSDRLRSASPPQAGLQIRPWVPRC